MLQLSRSPAQQSHLSCTIPRSVGVVPAYLRCVLYGEKPYSFSCWRSELIGHTVWSVTQVQKEFRGVSHGSAWTPRPLPHRRQGGGRNKTMPAVRPLHPHESQGPGCWCLDCRQVQGQLARGCRWIVWILLWRVLEIGAVTAKERTGLPLDRSGDERVTALGALFCG